MRTRDGKKGGERVPPHSDEAEISVLGGMLLEESAVDRAMELLTEDDFYHPAHRQIFRAVAGLRDQGHMPDAVAVHEELRRRGQLETAGGEEYLARIIEIVPTAANLPYHARLVLDAAVKRRLISAGTDIVAEAFEAPEDADQILNRAEERIFRLSEHRFKKAFTPINQLLQSAVMQLESLSARRESITGAPTGFTDLDELTAGFQLSDLIIVAGRPSLGKTSLALNIAAHAAITANLPVAIFSLEMSTEQLVQRLISTEALVSLKALRTGQATSEQWKRVADACDRLRRAAIYIDDSAILTALEMRAKARRLKQQRDIGLVIVDYLQLMESGARAESRQQEITEISRSLKALAKELNVPVIAISQLSRAPEQRTDQRPRLADLRESGCLAAGTRVLLPDSGTYAPIESLAGLSRFRVLALNTDSWRLEPAVVRRAFSTGRKPVFRLTTRLGRTIRATANHQFLTIDGWSRLDALVPGMRVALPRRLPAASHSSMSPSELALLGRLIGDGCTLPRHAIQYTTQDFVMAENGTTRQMQAGLETAYCGSTLYRQNLGRERAARLADVVGSDPLRQLARSDVYWDAIASIEPDGTEDVFDLTVDRLHNFVAEDIVVHNSLEQDADLVLFLYREKPGQGEAADPHGVTEIIVGKNRNGPTGSVKLVFLSDYMRFENHDPHHLP